MCCMKKPMQPSRGMTKATKTVKTVALPAQALAMVQKKAASKAAVNFTEKEPRAERTTKRTKKG